MVAFHDTQCEGRITDTHRRLQYVLRASFRNCYQVLPYTPINARLHQSTGDSAKICIFVLWSILADQDLFDGVGAYNRD